MKKLQLALAALCLMGTAFAEDATKEIVAQAPMDCSNMGADMQQFASQLNAMNKKTFCGQFSAEQRAMAIQYASQQDANGMTMTADRAVQKVAAENKMTPSARSPTGCPIK